MAKASRFNFWATVSENQYLLFNGISGALYELDREERTLALRFLDAPGELFDSNETALHLSLIEGGFVISDSLDETEVLRTRNRVECSHHHVLDLVISPTYECNFRCRYCYVDFKPGRMSRDVENRIVNYLERVLHQYEQVNISWFGGEPLLCLETVVRVSRQATAIARSSTAQLHNLISTNGYLLEMETAHRLSEAGIRFFHITIDGAGHDHDRLRVLANGNPSYIRIRENLGSLLAHIPDARVTLRMNANEDNVDSLSEVLNDIPPSFRRRIQVNITPILDTEGLPSLELHRKINRVIRHALQTGYLYYDVSIPVDRRTFCAADRYNNFHIAPSGALHKCTPAPGKPEVTVGRLNGQGLPELHERYEHWHRAPPVGDRCLDCSYLCFCAGGCRLERLRGNQDLGCKDKYEDIENMIMNRYTATINGALEVNI